MKTNPKTLGNQFEIEFARELSLWWSNGKDKDIFWHTHGSGSRKGISEQAGDIMAVKPEGDILMDGVIIECKRTKDDNLLLDLLRKDRESKIKKWWKKLGLDCRKWERDGLLVIKLINRTILCIYFNLVKYGDVSHANICGLYIMEWEEFKENFKGLKEE